MIETTENCFSWSPNELFPSPNISFDVSIQHLTSLKIIEESSLVCLKNTSSAGGQSYHNPKTNLSFPSFLSTATTYTSAESTYLPGTTFWINEWMAPGHMYYDLVLLQALVSTKIDRIILQRAPCERSDFCSGVGYFNSFFKGYFTAALDAVAGNDSGRGIPIYFRYRSNERIMKPLYLTSNSEQSNISSMLDPDMNIVLNDEMCFEKLLRRGEEIYPAVSSNVADRFRDAAYKLFKKNEDIKIDVPIKITYAYRDKNAKRHIGNVDYLVRKLEDEFSNHINDKFDNNSSHSKKVSICSINTSNNSRGYAEQISFVSEADIIISEHGAFQGYLY
jgi:hypothetical protein